MPEQLRMAAEVRTWLTEMRASDRAAARAVGAVTLALLIAGENLGPPTVRELGRAAALDDTHTALDRAYQRGLDITRDVRRAAADASTARRRAESQLGEAQALLARCQEQQRRAAAAGRAGLTRRLAADETTARDHLARLGQLHDRAAAAEGRLQAFNQSVQRRVDAFRTRKEVLKATYTAAQTERLIDEALAALEEQAQAERGDAEAERTTRHVAASRPRQISAAIRAFNQEIRNEYQQAGLDCPALADVQRAPDILELRPSGPDSLVRILFAFEPPDHPLLLAVGQITDQLDDVVRLASERLQRARTAAAPATPPPPAQAQAQAPAEFVSYDAQSFLAEFFPGEGPDIGARAADLAARAGSRTLAEARTWLGFSQAQVAERMGVRQERVSAIERGELTATEVRTLAAYVRALGGWLEIAAEFPGERIVLR